MSHGHQVLITFDIDDEHVQKYAEERAAQEIVKQIFGDYLSNSNWRTEENIKRYVNKIIEEMLEPMKEEMINQAVSQIVKNVHRTKAFKERFEEELGEDQNG